MSTVTATPDVSKTYGAAMVGLLVSCFLSGITTLQTHLYFQNGSRDRSLLRLAVASLWILDMIHLGSISAFVYHYAISNWGNREIMHQSTWTLGLQEMLNTWVTFIVQIFFIHRINVLSKSNWWILVPLYSLALLQLGFGTGGGVRSMLPQTIGHLASTRWRAAIWLIGGAVNDILIATILCYYLWRGRTVMNQRLIDQLIAYSMNTGLLTSIIASVDIGCFLAMPDNYVHLAFNFVLGRLYANSLLASLNMRRHIRRTNTFQLNSGEIGDPTVSKLQTGKVTIDALPIDREALAADSLCFYHGRSGTPAQSREHIESTSSSALDLAKGVVP